MDLRERGTSPRKRGEGLALDVHDRHVDRWGEKTADVLHLLVLSVPIWLPRGQIQRGSFINLSRWHAGCLRQVLKRGGHPRVGGAHQSVNVRHDSPLIQVASPFTR